MFFFFFLVASSLSPMIAQSVRAFLIATLLAFALYLVVQQLNRKPESTKKKGPETKEDKKQKQKQKRQAANEKDGSTKSQHKPFKGIVSQKIDVFTEQVCASFPDITADEARRVFPRKYEVHGHVVVVRLNDGTTEAALQPLAAAFAASFAPVMVDVVLLDVEGIVGELRRPSLKVLYKSSTALTDFAAVLRRTLRHRWRDRRAKHRDACSVSAEELEIILTKWTASPTYTMHVENGVSYTLDVARVMFSSGNTTERMHFATIHAVDETVVDMFCGIGYFTLPLAMHGNVAAVYALEKNPDSVDFIKVNAVLNRVDHLVHPICGDNREVGNEVVGKCDRVLMGYIPSCRPFLPRALSFLKRNEAGRSVGVIHYHFLADKPNAAADALKDVAEELGADVAAAARIADLRCIKSYAPKRFHYVADLVFS